MRYYLEITTEVNSQKVVAHREVFIEYPEEETLRCLEYEAEEVASKITGIPKNKIQFAKHYLWRHEKYDPKKHDDLACVDLNDVYDRQFYTLEES